MKFESIITITGKSGLFVLEGARSNGAFVRSLDSNKKEFISSRQHMYTPLDNITIYTTSEPVSLKSVFQLMEQYQADGNTILDAKSDANELRNFFLEILPNHDDEKVYPSDIKKIINWFSLVNEHKISFAQEEEAKK